MNESEMNESLWACGIPQRMWGGIERYVNKGIRPGDFLSAIITNNLVDAFHYADDENFILIGNYVRWFYNYAPSQCWHSKENMQAWIQKGGLEEQSCQEKE